MGTPRDPDAEGLDALRRRLYRPGSTESDLRRYLAERSAIAPEPAPQSVPALPHAPRRRFVPVAALSAVVAVALAVSLSQLHALRAPARSAATASPVPVLVQDIGDGTTLTVPQRASIRTATTPIAIDGTAVVGQRFEGSGNAMLVVDPPRRAMHGGVATVLLTSIGPVPVSWRALSLVYLGQWTAVPVVLARGSSAEPPGVGAPRTFRYRDAPPTRIAVIAPAGVRWSVLVGVTGPEHALH
ncbi:hypothetical protein [Amnibacterium kyonggiense]|uniref:Uncharacterized protein n=1 Tax=Amnibacterium kyonggiense TaxID=595671 RepID=A0A4R7FLI9_9MICO|nr:hypothetical protein [Amnibacterium kyonggiense]TDS77239.1 hypothetical protein CLV52_2180 [Amnibacterium kyonggiense]